MRFIRLAIIIFFILQFQKTFSQAIPEPWKISADKIGEHEDDGCWN